jgi:hypothetical protein
MKKHLLILVLSVLAITAPAQKSIDNLFDKYAGRDGFTTVTINGALLKMAEWFGQDEGDDILPGHISQIRILSQDDEHMKVDNFYTSVINDLDMSKYEEFMRVKSTDQDLRMLVRTDGDKFKEFLLIAGGDENAIIQIKGSMTMSDAKKFSESAEKNKGNLKISGEKN